MNDNLRLRPEIQVGFMDDSCSFLVKEIEYGIEEEGCLSSSYLMDDSEDIRLLRVEAGITVFPDLILIFHRETGVTEILMEIQNPNQESARKAGHSAARFLLGNPLF